MSSLGSRDVISKEKDFRRKRTLPAGASEGDNIDNKSRQVRRRGYKEAKGTRDRVSWTALCMLAFRHSAHVYNSGLAAGTSLAFLVIPINPRG